MKQMEITPSKREAQPIELTVYRPAHIQAPALTTYLKQVQSTKAIKNQ